MLSSSRDVLLNLSETTSPKKLFPSDCIKLYIYRKLYVSQTSSEQTFILYIVRTNANIGLCGNFGCFYNYDYFRVYRICRHATKRLESP